MHMIKTMMRLIFLALCALLISIGSGHCMGGTVEGSIQLRIKDGSVHHGDWIRVLLTREKVDLPHTGALADLNKYQQMNAINKAHLDFNKSILKRMQDPEFIAASTLTVESGTFKFADISPGKYWVVITFPAVIKMHKVAWQYPVEMVTGHTTTVILNNKNLALPTFTRD
jgi:hypothetical protein